METSAREVHENMNAVIDYQTHHRLRETQVKLQIYVPLKYLCSIFVSGPAQSRRSERANNDLERLCHICHHVRRLWTGWSFLNLVSLFLFQITSLYDSLLCRCLSWSRSSQRSVPPRCMEPTDILGQKSCDVTKHVTMWHNLSLFWQTVTVVICDEWLLQSSGQFSRENCLHHILLVATHSNRIIADMF